MSDLKKVLEEQIQGVPKLLLRHAVKKKLKDQSIEGEGLLEALTDHILSESKDTFHWDDGHPDQTRDLHIEFTDEDSKDIEEAYKNFMKDGLPEVIQSSVKDGAKALVKALVKRWPEQKVEERSDMRHFRDRIDLRWAKAIDPLRMMLIASREVGQEFAEKLARSKAKNGIVKREAIMALHMRACQTTMEILTLLENGLAPRHLLLHRITKAGNGWLLGHRRAPLSSKKTLTDQVDMGRFFRGSSRGSTEPCPDVER